MARGTGHDHARGGPAPRREHEPAVHLTQAVCADLGLPAPEPARVPAFAAVEVATVPGSLEELSQAEPRRDTVTPGGVIEIELPHGRRVRIAGRVEPAVVTAALRVLVRR
jgi:hypothetical protein